jgi:nicotinamidase-related amidase
VTALPAPAIVVIDAQNYMVGPPPGAEGPYPSACGEQAAAALRRLAPLLEAARARGVPVVYTRFVMRRDGATMGVYGRKRDLLDIDGWAIEGTTGAEIHALVAPQPQDLVLTKHKPSAFFGTPLMSLLIDRGVRTVIHAGGSTANCVRASVVDSYSYGFRTVVASDCVFDRFDVSHRQALVDMERHFAAAAPAQALVEALPSEPLTSHSVKTRISQ